MAKISDQLTTELKVQSTSLLTFCLGAFLLLPYCTRFSIYCNSGLVAIAPSPTDLNSSSQLARRVESPGCSRLTWARLVRVSYQMPFFPYKAARSKGDKFFS